MGFETDKQVESDKQELNKHEFVVDGTYTLTLNNMCTHLFAHCFHTPALLEACTSRGGRYFAGWINRSKGLQQSWAPCMGPIWDHPWWREVYARGTEGATHGAQAGLLALQRQPSRHQHTLSVATAQHCSHSWVNSSRSRLPAAQGCQEH